MDAWSSPPYLHDGSAATIGDAISRHDNVSLTADELQKLEAFIRQVDVSDAP